MQFICIGGKILADRASKGFFCKNNLETQVGLGKTKLTYSSTYYIAIELKQRSERASHDALESFTAYREFKRYPLGRP